MIEAEGDANNTTDFAKLTRTFALTLQMYNSRQFGFVFFGVF